MHFDPSNAAHLALLPKDYQGITEMDRLAAEAEADILNYYTETGSALLGTEIAPGVYMQLSGYSSDPLQLDATLALNLRREIALLIVWRHQRERQNLMVQSESGKEKSKTLSPKAWNIYPDGFGRWLRPFDLRTRAVLWSI